MSGKRNILSILALLLALAGLAAAVFSCMQVRELREGYEARLAEMESIHALLQQEIDDAAVTEPAIVTADLKSWELKSRAWYDNCGAAVTLTAVPATYQAGMTSALRVMLEGQTVAELPCVWDGTAFTATADLTAQNGYSYLFVLNPNSSNPTEIVLASPENPTDALAVYLADSIHSYCTLAIGDWSADNSHLTLSSCHLQAQLPQVTTDGNAARCQVTKLILRHNGETLRTHWVTLNPAQSSGWYELDVENLSFLLPQLEEGNTLELWLEVTLSDDQILTAIGGSWDYLDGHLQLTAG